VLDPEFDEGEAFDEPFADVLAEPPPSPDGAVVDEDEDDDRLSVR
jgi:hypothetical protein